jgi:hypothetical protein
MIHLKSREAEAPFHLIQPDPDDFAEADFVLGELPPDATKADRDRHLDVARQSKLRRIGLEA